MTNEDAISREAVIRLVEQYPNIIGNRCSGLIADIKHLPPITPSYNSVKTELEPCEDCVSREDAVNALRKALYKYEDETEKQFKESKELNLEDWFQHRIFVQNMNDIDIQTILELPPVKPQTKVGYWVEMELVDTGVSKFSCSVCKEGDFYNQIDNPFIPTKYCPNCGADMRGENNDT